jgi:hypothetical protein
MRLDVCTVFMPQLREVSKLNGHIEWTMCARGTITSGFTIMQGLSTSPNALTCYALCVLPRAQGECQRYRVLLEVG